MQPREQRRRGTTAFALFFMGLAWASSLWWPAAVGRAQESPKPGEATAAEVSLELRGQLPTSRRLTAADLQRLPRTEVRTKDARNEGKEIVYAGVLLTEVLKAGGLTFDSGMTTARETVRASLLVEAADGYRVVFALAELDPALSDRPVLLADTRDGQPLGTAEGRWRLVVPGDKRPTRWMRQITALTVRRD